MKSLAQIAYEAWEEEAAVEYPWSSLDATIQQKWARIAETIHTAAMHGLAGTVLSRLESAVAPQKTEQERESA